MRDITEDLRERQEAARAEIALLMTKYEQDRRELESKYADQHGRAVSRLSAIETLLESETGERLPLPLDHSARELKLPLQDFILNALSSSAVLTKDEIRELAQRSGYADDSGSAGRAVHTTLFNAVKSGRIVNKGDKYELPAQNDATFVRRRLRYRPSLNEQDPQADPASEPHS